MECTEITAGMPREKQFSASSRYFSVAKSRWAGSKSIMRWRFKISHSSIYGGKGAPLPFFATCTPHAASAECGVRVAPNGSGAALPPDIDEMGVFNFHRLIGIGTAQRGLGNRKYPLPVR